MNLADYYPELIRQLPEYEGRFSANKLQANNCDVLFATYPAGTAIETHQHETENIGVITKGKLLLTMDGKTLGTGGLFNNCLMSQNLKILSDINMSIRAHLGHQDAYQFLFTIYPGNRAICTTPIC